MYAENIGQIRSAAVSNILLSFVDKQGVDRQIDTRRQYLPG